MAVTLGGFIRNALFGFPTPAPPGIVNGDLRVIWVGGYVDPEGYAEATGYTNVLNVSGSGGTEEGSEFGSWLVKEVTDAGSEGDVSVTSPTGLFLLCWNFWARGCDLLSLPNSAAPVSGKSGASQSVSSASSISLPSIAIGRTGSMAIVATNSWNSGVWDDVPVPSPGGFTLESSDFEEVALWSAAPSTGSLSVTVDKTSDTSCIASILTLQPSLPPGAGNGLFFGSS